MMSDADIAAVATYIRTTWGNKASPVKAYGAAELLGMPAK
jgi:mono/diheme cytochrome c family protein